MKNKIVLIAFEKLPEKALEKRDHLTHSNPQYWKMDGVRNRFTHVYAPSYPAIEKAYEKEGKIVFRPENPSGEDNIQDNDNSVLSSVSSPVNEESVSITDNEYNEDSNVQKDDAPTEDDFIVEDVTSEKNKEEESIVSQYPNAASIPWPKVRSLAAQVSSEPVKSKEQAIEIVQEHYYS